MSRWHRFSALKSSDKRLLLEAAYLLLRAKVELAVSPFAKVVGRAPRAAGPGADEAISRVGWAVETTARHIPVPLTCLPQALAAWWMLQSRGRAASLIYGVASDVKDGFSAHAWVEVDGVPVVGGRAARGFTILTRFPQE